ncbi:hypothetical protein CEXT_129971 [Caerostris extrusa]|uniref:Uncharacterized protein n=1 Tax=Caerostris extrusa TaxID=172846 RepID=A0AAV4Q7A4_CAEEX|nr:hypothetical protein CEXT_129971 [Caerostris extrusa]
MRKLSSVFGSEFMKLIQKNFHTQPMSSEMKLAALQDILMRQNHCYDYALLENNVLYLRACIPFDKLLPSTILVCFDNCRKHLRQDNISSWARVCDNGRSAGWYTKYFCTVHVIDV